MSDKLQRARHIRPNPPDPTDRNAAPFGPPRPAVGESATATRPRPRQPPATTRGRTPRRAFPPAVAIAAWTRRSCVLRPTRAPQGSRPVVGSHAGLDRTIPGATAEGSIRQQEVIVAEAAEAEAAGRGGASAGKLSAESVGASAALISICVIISRITGFARTWAMAFALGSTFWSPACPTRWPTTCRTCSTSWSWAACSSRRFDPVYLSVKKQLGDRRGNEYASNLLTIVVVLLAIVSVLCMVFAGQIIYTQSFYSNQDEMALAVFFFQFFSIQIVFYGASSIVSGLLNANREYFWSSFAPVFNNLIVIASFILYAVIAQTDQNLAFLAIAIGNPLGVFVQMAFQIPALKKVGIRLRPHRLARSGAGRHAAPRRARGVRHGVLVRHGVDQERCLLRVRGQRPFGHRLRTAVVHVPVLVPRSARDHHAVHGAVGHAGRWEHPRCHRGHHRRHTAKFSSS